VARRSDDTPARPSPWTRAAGLALVAAWVASVFGAAGTLRWGGGWAYLVALAAGLLVHRWYVSRRNPPLLGRRRAIGPGTKAWDLAWVAAFWPLMLLVPLVAGLDVVRCRGAPLPAWCAPAGALIVGLGLAASGWAMGENPFFEGTVRLQPGQRVVDAGPYRLLRHPGYLGLALWALGTPPFLRSRWAFLPASLAAAWVAVRTALEDRLLMRELAGYDAYAARVRWRLVPGLW